jgi:hypothetical protein
LGIPSIIPRRVAFGRLQLRGQTFSFFGRLLELFLLALEHFEKLVILLVKRAVCLFTICRIWRPIGCSTSPIGLICITIPSCRELLTKTQDGTLQCFRRWLGLVGQRQWEVNPIKFDSVGEDHVALVAFAQLFSGIAVGSTTIWLSTFEELQICVCKKIDKDGFTVLCERGGQHPNKNGKFLEVSSLGTDLLYILGAEVPTPALVV